MIRTQKFKFLIHINIITCLYYPRIVYCSLINLGSGEVMSELSLMASEDGTIHCVIISICVGIFSSNVIFLKIGSNII